MMPRVENPMMYNPQLQKALVGVKEAVQGEEKMNFFTIIL
jgi:hypothetical protein